jgi:hypothetical protein
MKTRTPNAGDLARAYAEMMARNRLKQTHYAPGFKVVRENVREVPCPTKSKTRAT